ncbi:hypothetical protein [Succinivibrio dextrinosolvens]|jgi:hypothetical protein|uniref:Uncharacterized protein n=1 Tax=Succinivibrio dextrinosolvens DSM 3072 TaxID=1123324 RepID=A0A1T4V272_9GAMM|nr:hypothetical protein [Succinivibrio dextrinosolvens]SKA59040.1 hypothetical protein SAMN02745213_00579 [Succinivibrio dextrinosolvens DSM 3072]
MNYNLGQNDVFKAWEEKDQKVFYNLGKEYSTWSFDLKKAMDEGLDSVTFKKLAALKNAVDIAVDICNQQS